MQNDGEDCAHFVNEETYKYGEFHDLYKDYRVHSETYVKFIRRTVSTFCYVYAVTSDRHRANFSMFSLPNTVKTDISPAITAKEKRNKIYFSRCFYIWWIKECST